jgi:hypothetical protein
MKLELLTALSNQGIDVEIGGALETTSDGDVFMATVELTHQESGTTIGFIRRPSEIEALAELVAKCVGDVARVKVSMESLNIINDSDINEVE